MKKLERHILTLKNFLKGSQFGIKRGYIHRDEYSYFDDTENQDNWQLEVYKAALKECRTYNYTRVLDFGCGSGYKLLKYFKDYHIAGMDVEPTISFLKNKYPENIWHDSNLCDNSKLDYEIIICADVIEHVLRPDYLMERLLNTKNLEKIVISTPERELVYEGEHSGPPKNNTHIREWNFEEFRSFISKYLIIEKHVISNHAQRTQMIIGRPY